MKDFNNIIVIIIIIMYLDNDFETPISTQRKGQFLEKWP